MNRKHLFVAPFLGLLIVTCTSNNPSSSDACNGATAPSFTAEINGSPFIADSLYARLYYYQDTGPFSGYRMYVYALDDTTELDFLLDHFDSDGHSVPEGTYNENAISNRFMPDYSFIAGGNLHVSLTLPVSGSCVITGCNSEKQLLCGTFEFTEYYPSDNGDTIFIQNGLFENIRYEIE